MKPLHVIAVAVLSSTLAAGVVALVFVNGAENENVISADEASYAARVETALRRLDEIIESVDRLDSRTGRLESATSELEILRSSAAERHGLDAFEVKLAALEERLSAESSVAALAGKADPASVQAFEQALDKVVTARMREQQRKQFDTFRPFIESGFKRGMTQAAKRLNLNPDQTRRLNESTGKAFEKALPQIGLMFDPSASPAEKAAAIDTVKQSMTDVSSEAASYLDPTQLTELEKMQSQSLEGIERMRGFIGGGTPPPQAPPPSSGTDGN